MMLRFKIGFVFLTSCLWMQSLFAGPSLLRCKSDLRQTTLTAIADRLSQSLKATEPSHAPPSYEEATREPPLAPPSYEEATRAEKIAHLPLQPAFASDGGLNPTGAILLNAQLKKKYPHLQSFVVLNFQDLPLLMNTFKDFKQPVAFAIFGHSMNWSPLIVADESAYILDSLGYKERTIGRDNIEQITLHLATSEHQLEYFAPQGARQFDSISCGIDCFQVIKTLGKMPDKLKTELLQINHRTEYSAVLQSPSPDGNSRFHHINLMPVIPPDIGKVTQSNRMMTHLAEHLERLQLNHSVSSAKKTSGSSETLEDYFRRHASSQSLQGSSPKSPQRSEEGEDLTLASAIRTSHPHQASDSAEFLSSSDHGSSSPGLARSSREELLRSSSPSQLHSPSSAKTTTEESPPASDWGVFFHSKRQNYALNRKSLAFQKWTTQAAHRLDEETFDLLTQEQLGLMRVSSVNPHLSKNAVYLHHLLQSIKEFDSEKDSHSIFPAHGVHS